ncbi:amino acid permease-associated region [Methanocorpusculum labreanum Z]|uniref:Amino acid permease-associated region n=1 Tax=Methanocorpusculum labreanum (strain ATCC 43576 / DSM 4855 / Z) TaxID=410358 RepID=A2SSB3_METLZ|nr:amino acid permease [Methanocorpusculum labreanum]ABN07219.1 amino acid permease-associated region [Methanocorpusculum labreanum Z]
MATKPSVSYKLSLTAFILITFAAIMSMRTFPSQSVVGWQSIFFCLLAFIVYLIPASLVSAELATGWPQEGGVYVWVKEAFGEKWGFTAIWLQWFQMTIGFISVLTFIAATFSYIINPELANNKLYLFIFIVVIWWGLTFLNLRGLKAYTRISSISVVLGTFIPAAILLIGGAWYIFSGNPVQLTLQPTVTDLIPNFSSLSNLVMLVTFVFLFIGIEMTASHAQDISNVKKNYPLGIFVVGLVITAISIVGAMIVALLVPADNINLLAGIMQTFEVIFAGPFSWVVLIIALLIAIGAIGQVSTWILGPVRGLFATAKEGTLPPVLQKTNKNDIPVNMLILQGILITFWGAVYALAPGGVNSSFWMLFALTTTVYIVMYFLMYAAAIRLRYTRPDVPRAFKIPGGKAGMWLVGGFGFVMMAILFVVAMLPPTQISEGAGFVAFMIIGTVVVAAIPLIIYAFKKPEWKVNQPETKE